MLDAIHASLRKKAMAAPRFGGSSRCTERPHVLNASCEALALFGLDLRSK